MSRPGRGGPRGGGRTKGGQALKRALDVLLADTKPSPEPEDDSQPTTALSRAILAAEAAGSEPPSVPEPDQPPAPVKRPVGRPRTRPERPKREKSGAPTKDPSGKRISKGWKITPMIAARLDAILNALERRDSHRPTEISVVEIAIDHLYNTLVLDRTIDPRKDLR